MRGVFPELPDIGTLLAPAWPADSPSDEVRFEPMVPRARPSDGRLTTPESAQFAASAMRATAFFEGQESGRAEALRDADELVAEERKRGEASLAAARRDWTLAEGERLASIIEQRFSVMEEKLRDEVAALLEACVSRAVELAVIEGFADRVSRTIGRLARAKIKLRGRADFVSAAATSLERRGIEVTLDLSRQVGLSVELGETTIAADPAEHLAKLRMEAR